jgi:hypothetical protein
MEEVRLLSLDERVLLALLYFEIPELSEICKPNLSAAVNDAGKVHRITQLIHDFHVPTLSTELSEDQMHALKTGVRPDGFKPRIKLNYHGVLSEEDGNKLEDLFNEGKFVQLGQKTNRPMTTYRLTVSDEKAVELAEIHGRWLENRICILVDGSTGQYWVTPDTMHRKQNHQDYVVVPSSHMAPGKHHAIRPPVDEKAMITDVVKHLTPSWRESLDEMVLAKPELSFVQTMLNHFLQPAHVQLMHHDQLNGKVLLLTYQGVTYRVVGISAQGTLMVTTHLDQDLVYENTFPFRHVAREGVWSQVEGK